MPKAIVLSYPDQKKELLSTDRVRAFWLVDDVVDVSLKGCLFNSEDWDEDEVILEATETGKTVYLKMATPNDESILIEAKVIERLLQPHEKDLIMDIYLRTRNKALCKTLSPFPRSPLL